MPVFRYQALDPSGKQVSAERESAGADELKAWLKSQGYTVLNVQQVGDGAAPARSVKASKPEPGAPATPPAGTPAPASPPAQPSRSEGSRSAPQADKQPAAAPRAGNAALEPEPRQEPRGLSLSFGVSRKDVVVLTRQLATTLHAGLPLMRILSVLRRESNHPRLKVVLNGLANSIQRGKSFSEALAEYPNVFDTMYVNMVKVGETGGSMPEVVGRLATLLEKEMSMRRKISSALAYPTFIFIFTICITYALVAFLMPMFTPMFLDANLDLERDYPLTNLLIIASNFATDPLKMGMLVLGGIVLFILWKVASGTAGGRYSIDYAKLYFPFMTEMVRKVVAARFARAFSLLLKSGVGLLQAMGLVAGASGNIVVGGKIREAARGIQEGQGISRTLRSVGLFPDLVVQMAAMGEEAGSLPEMFEKVADYYEEEVDASVAAATALLEPAVMILIGGLVGVFVMGVLLPILGISTGYQNQL